MRNNQPTAMTQAFKKAGGKTAKDRLNEIALAEMVTHADNTMEAIEAVWTNVQKDAQMLVALFNPYGEYRGAIGRVFHQLKHEISVSSAKPGQKLDPRHRKVLKIVAQEKEEQRKAEEAQRRADREEQSRRDAEYREYLASWHKTPLWNLTIGDKPIWQNSVGTIRAWLPTQKKKLQAVEMLIDGVPDDGRPLEYYRRPEDVKEIWRILQGTDEDSQA